MIDDILDNPVWNAMISSNNKLATGNDHVKIFQQDVGPFAGMKNFKRESFEELYDLVPTGRIVVIFTPVYLDIPGYWKMIEVINALQMTFEGPKQVSNRHHEIVPLEKSHAPQMIALTKLTNPGPFLQRTIEFGNYKGIFLSGQLLSMAGQRLHAWQYVEVSAVCTHPDHTGKGYSKSLINNQVDLIVGRGEIPFLHVKAENEHAIDLYKHLGFAVRKVMNIYVLQRKSA
ncbi:MAG: GNAT family N-acetyltransferase [Ginsengibacter sp.]